MNKTEAVFSFVRSECHRLGIDSAGYGVGNDFVDGLGQYIFSFRDKKWVVYFYERGKEDNFSTFESSFDAVKFFFMKICTNHENRILPQILFKNFPD